MGMVRVYNDNTFEHKELFKGSNIVIAPGKFIEMDRGEAKLFAGQFYQPKYLADGVQDPRSFKKIRVVPVEDLQEEPVTEVDENVCQACGFQAASPAGLKIHISKNHAGDMLDEDARKELSS
jgi:hypothetical protein